VGRAPEAVLGVELDPVICRLPWSAGGLSG
jgi:hypothetical protein